MDTDDLSTEAYRGIIIEAEGFDHDLTLDRIIQNIEQVRKIPKELRHYEF